MLVLHDDVEYDEAGGTRREIHTTLVILILAEEELGVLALVQALEEEAGYKRTYLHTELEGEPKADKVAQVWRVSRP